MGRTLGTVLIAVALAMSLPARSAAADVPSHDRDPVFAESLFRSGRTAFERGDFVAACNDFTESHRLDPAVGTELNLSECEEKLGRTASAWRHLREAIELLRPEDDRLAIARARLPRLDKRVPRLVVRLKADAPTGTTVARDGVELAAASIGSPEPIDPGEHELRIRARDHDEVTIRMSLAEGEARTVDVGPGPAQRGVGAAPPSNANAMPAAALETNAPGNGQRLLGLVVGGAGIVGVGVGAVFGIVAKGKFDDAKTTCGDTYPQCKDGATAVATDQNNSAHGSATVSTLAVVAGGVALAAGAVLFFTAPSATKTRVGVAPTIAGLDLIGRW